MAQNGWTLGKLEKNPNPGGLFGGGNGKEGGGVAREEDWKGGTGRRPPWDHEESGGGKKKTKGRRGLRPPTCGGGGMLEKMVHREKNVTQNLKHERGGDSGRSWDTLRRGKPSDLPTRAPIPHRKEETGSGPAFV